MKSDKNHITINNMPGQIIKKRDIEVIDSKINITVITVCSTLSEEFNITLRSIINQTLYSFKLIIVTHNKIELEKYIQNLNLNDNRVEVIEYDFVNNAAAKNYAVSLTKSKYVCIVNESVYLDNTYLECLNIAVINNDEKFGFSNVIDKNDKFNTLNDDITKIFKEILLIYTGAYIISKDCLDIMCGFNICDNEDFELWNRLIKEGYYPVKINNYGIWSNRIEKEDKSLNKTLINYDKLIEFPVNDNYNTDTFPRILKDNTIYKKSKKNILFILPCVVVGGADKFALDLVRNLNKDEYEITIIFTRVSYYEWRPLFELEAIEVFDLTDFAKRVEWSGFIEYIIRSRQIDLVFCSNSLYGYHIIPWLKNKNPEIPIVDYLHAEDWTWKSGGLPRDSIAVSKFIDKTYTCTKHLQNIMYEKMNKKVENTMPVYIGVDNNYFDSNKINFEDYKFYEKLEKHKEKKIILFVCRLVDLKRPIFAIRVLENLVRQDKNIVLFVVGDGECLAKMKSEVNKFKLQNNIEFFGMQKDVRPFYKIAKVTMITSLTEGLTLSAYESLSMGTPVVSADVGGQKELINNECGKIIKKYQDYVKDLYNYNYDKTEIDEYSNAILDIINSKNYNKISKYCRNRINEKFSIKIMVETLSNEFNTLIKNKSSISKSLCNNEELAERYMILYNDTFRYYKNENHIVSRNMILKGLDLLGITALLKFIVVNSKIFDEYGNYKLVYMLWDIPLYRFLVTNIKKVLRKK
jgi:glycosyltransferase involved in cell wall biosynthesis